VTLCSMCHAEEHKDENIYNLMIKRMNGETIWI
jgi:hypothetical protein